MLADLVYFVLLLAFSPLILFKLISDRNFRWNLRRQFVFNGLDEKELKKLNSAKAKVLVVAASLGEARLAWRLAELYNKIKPVSFIFLVSTRSGYEYILQQKGAAIEYFCCVKPFDFSFLVKCKLSRLNIKQMIVLESDFWPNLIAHVSKNTDQIFGVNTRISAKTLKSYLCLALIYRKALNSFKVFYYTADSTAKNLKNLGVNPQKLVQLASFKAEVLAPASKFELDLKFENLTVDIQYRPRFIFTAGSLQVSEVDTILKAWQEFNPADRAKLLVIVPRYPHKKDAFIARASKLLNTVQISILNKGSSVLLNREILLVASFGVLRDWYQLSDCVFVGGSLSKRGGQNFLEPIAYKKLTAIGPYTPNFEAERKILLATGALSIIKNTGELSSFLQVAYTKRHEFTKNIERAYQVCLEASRSLENSVVDISRHLYVEAR